MDWYRLAFGSPQINTNNKVMQRDSPDIIDMALDGTADMGTAVSPFQGSKPGLSHKRKRRRTKRRQPGNHLFEGPKHPTDGTTTRPTGDLTAKRRQD